LARILYFSRDYTTHDRRFLSALADTEHQVYFLKLERRGPTLEDRPLPTHIEQIQWSGGRAPFRWRDMPRLLNDLKRVIRELQPDLLHAGPIQTAGLLGALSGFQPLISMSWGSDLLQDADSSAWYRWATRYTLGHSQVMIGDCNPVRQKAISFGLSDERIITFPWGVDLAHYSPVGPSRRATNQPEFSGAPFILLSTRGWEPIYGVDVIARAFVKAARQRPQLQLLMLGNGSQASLLRKIFTDGEVLEQVHFPGQVSQTELPQFFRTADLYVSASHSDGTSISLLEAMACGRPVLVSDIPGNRPWVEPGKHGWLFPDGDSDGLTQSIVTAQENHRLLPAMGRAARKMAEARANWAENFQQLLKAYQLALNKELPVQALYPTSK
jgi:glycosyltransferase involved in cell wall biosynthesis